MNKDIRSRVSRWAHASGITHASTVKARLLRDLERLEASGAPYATLIEHVDDIERRGLIDVPVVPSVIEL